MRSCACRWIGGANVQLIAIESIPTICKKTQGKMSKLRILHKSAIPPPPPPPPPKAVAAKPKPAAASKEKESETAPLPPFWNREPTKTDLLETLFRSGDNDLLRMWTVKLEELYLTTYKLDSIYQHGLTEAFAQLKDPTNVDDKRSSMQYIFMLALLSDIEEWKYICTMKGHYIRLNPFIFILQREMPKLILGQTQEGKPEGKYGPPAYTSTHDFTNRMIRLYCTRYDPFGKATEHYYTNLCPSLSSSSSSAAAAASAIAAAS